MSITAIIWNFVIKQLNNFKFIVTEAIWWFKINHTGWGFNITQQNDWSFNIAIEPDSNWILRHGYWDDDGEWVDSEIWRDS